MKLNQLFEAKYIPPSKFYVIRGDKVNTSDPMASSELVRSWAEHGPMTYLFVALETGGRAIIGGSGTPQDYEVQRGTEILVMDDGNGTTKFGRLNGKDATVLRIATTPEEMKLFPRGVFMLYAMK